MSIHHLQRCKNFIKSSFLFSLQVAGVQISANGYSWLQSVTVNHKVKFLPLSKADDHVECRVLLLNSSPHNVSTTESESIEIQFELTFVIRLIYFKHQNWLSIKNIKFVVSTECSKAWQKNLKLLQLHSMNIIKSKKFICWREFNPFFNVLFVKFSSFVSKCCAFRKNGQKNISNFSYPPQNLIVDLMESFSNIFNYHSDYIEPYLPMKLLYSLPQFKWSAITAEWKTLTRFGCIQFTISDFYRTLHKLTNL